MVRQTPRAAPPPISLAERKRPPDISLTEAVISSPVSIQTKNRNLSFIRLEFTTRQNGAEVNNALPTQVKKLFATDPTLEIYPIDTWPTQYITVSSSVKAAPETDKHNTNHTEKTQKKLPTLATSDTIPTDSTGFEKYFQYTSDEHHPGQTKKIVVRFYSAGSKTMAELKNPCDHRFPSGKSHVGHRQPFRHPPRVHHRVASRSPSDRHEPQSLPTKPLRPSRRGRRIYPRIRQHSRVHASYIEQQAPKALPIIQRCPFSRNAPLDPNVSTIHQSRQTYRYHVSSNQKKTIRTSLSECPTDPLQTVHAMLLQNMLASIYDRVRLPDRFIPYSLKQTHPSLYLTAIQVQSVFLKSCTVIRVDGFRSGGLDLPHTNTTLRTIIARSKLFSR
jgi:hypothetical protein